MSHKLRTFIGVSVVVILTILLHSVGWLQGEEERLRSIMNPLTASMHAWRTRQEGTTLASHACALALSTTTARLTMLEEENASLREMESFVRREREKTVGADVVGLRTDPIGETLVLNRGSEENITEGDAVIVANGILVGKVVQTHPGTSLVETLGGGNSKVAAMLLNGTRSIGIVEGGYGASIRMILIPQDVSISLGDMIVTSGLESGIPAGLLIGRVTAVEKEAYQPFQAAVLTPSVNPDAVRQASVILGTASQPAL